MANLYFSRATCSIKIILTILFAILWIGESIDSHVDIGDLVVPALLILMINDIYMHMKRDLQPRFKNQSENTLGIRNPLSSIMKPAFSFIFSILLILPVLFDFNFFEENQIMLWLKASAIIWSLIYLVINVKRLRTKIAVPQIIITNVALGIFVGAVILL
ncbi:hypothetical protein OAT67_06120 [Bacteriovoracaceae bacterium]|nr:hypothetical protein [Bacteriovoracaceae bacterium]